MAKEYFSHDYNARNDRKIAALVKDYKAAGYGVFWAICEMMHEEGGQLEFDDMTIGAISKDLNEDVLLIKEVLGRCVFPYKLFQKVDESLISNRVKRNFDGRNEKRVAKIEAGRLGGIKSGESRRTKQNEAELEATEAQLEATKQSKVKESKVKEIKVKENTERVRPDEKFELDLPEMKINAAVEYVSRTKNVKADKNLILSIWSVFKQKNFTGEKIYKSNSDIFRHFFESLKYENFSQNGTYQQSNSGGSKSGGGTSADRIEAARNF